MTNDIIKLILAALLGAIAGGFVAYRFNLRLEKLRRERLIKDKATVVAELLAKWTVVPMNIYECNKLSYELSLYLPADLYNKLSQTLSHAQGAPNVKDILILVREHFNEKKDGLKAATIIHWP